MTYYLSRLFSILLVIVISSVLAAGFAYQLITGLDPCPLCFLQRAAMVGIAIGQVLSFRFGLHLSHHALSLFHALFGAAVSVRHICLHICDTALIGDIPVWGLKLPTWCFIVMASSLFVLGVLLYMYNPKWKLLKFPFFDHLEKFASIYLLCMIIGNIVNVVMVHHVQLKVILN